MKRTLVLGFIFAALVFGFQQSSRTDTLADPGARKPSNSNPGEAELRAACSKAIKLIQKSQAGWYQKETCTSCHHQLLPEISIDLARDRGVAVDETIARSITTQAFANLKDLDGTVQGYDYIDVVSNAWQLMAAHSAGIGPSLTTSVEAQFILSRQLADGSWPTIDNRPPQSSSVITTTAVCAEALQYYLPEQFMGEKERAIRLARTWLLKTQPRSTEDRTYQVLGLKWTDAAEAARKKAARQLLAEQRTDGGWSQLPGMDSDAYSTGEVLIALREGAAIPISDPGFQRGLRFLLTSQQADGSWRVKSRLHPPAPVSPPYVNMGFPPFQHDQFISIMGTTWATAALLQAIPAKAGGNAHGSPDSSLSPADQAPWMQVALNGTASELKRLLDEGMKPDSKTAGGTTALMLAARDPQKVKLLLDRGADVNARSAAGVTALMVASRYRGNVETVKLMLAKGAKPAPDTQVEVRNSASALFYAVMAGDSAIVRTLLDAGAKLDRMNILGTFWATPLNYAVTNSDTSLVEYLISKGADPNELDDDKISAVSWAVIGGRGNVLNVLLSRGANVNPVDKFGMTPLLYAASINLGDTAVMERLIAAGADLKAKNKDGLTALDLAKNYHHGAMVNLLSGKMATR